MLRTYIVNAINTRFNLNLSNEKCFNRHDDLIECYHYCLITQDWDEINEFIYMNELAIPEDKRPLYFPPQSNYGCILLPKIKIRWAFRAKQIKLGQKLYNVLEGNWTAQGAFVPKIAAGDSVVVKLIPYHGGDISSGSRAGPAVVLIPFKNYTACGDRGAAPETFSIADDKVSCVYNAVYYNVSFNRQGMYINRKYRDKVEQIVPEQLPENYIIMEPAAIYIRFSEHDDLKINLS